MPWTDSSVLAQRERFLMLARQNAISFKQLCVDFGISRKTGYKWLKRGLREGARGLADQSRAPRRPACAQAERWRAQVLALRRRHRAWGAKKLRSLLVAGPDGGKLPSARAIERWLREKNLLRPWRRAPAGPVMPAPGLTVARGLHEVWTVDFKGWYRTGDGERHEPLTIREMHSRYVLAIRLLGNQSDAAARAVFQRAFREHGLPEAIRVDNGAPFAGVGALGLSRLSVWWCRLGIRVEFTRPGRPGDNAAHEQMHGLFAREVARRAGATRRSEQRRVERWRRQYNDQRPHESLGQQPPARFYAKSPRPHLGRLPELVYAEGWEKRRVRPHGDIKWQGRLRFIGRAFVGERVGLQAAGEGQWAVYLGSMLIGVLHAGDGASMRPAKRKRAEPAAQ